MGIKVLAPRPRGLYLGREARTRLGIVVLIEIIWFELVKRFQRKACVKPGRIRAALHIPLIPYAGLVDLDEQAVPFLIGRGPCGDAYRVMGAAYPVPVVAPQEPSFPSVYRLPAYGYINVFRKDACKVKIRLPYLGIAFINEAFQRVAEPPEVLNLNAAAYAFEPEVQSEPRPRKNRLQLVFGSLVKIIVVHEVISGPYLAGWMDAVF